MMTRIRKKPSQRTPLVSPARESPLFQRQQLLSPATDKRESHTYPVTNSGFNFGNIPVLQPKLTIGQPNDKYEQEADQVADQVMRMPVSGIQRQQDVEDEEEEETLQAKPMLQRQSDNSEKEEEEEKETMLQAKTSGAAAGVSPAVGAGIQSMQGGGQPLAKSSRAFFEPRFGHNFGRVRIHNDLRAANMARAVNARAFTVGRNIAFGAGQYQPGSPQGKKLLAHELTHVVQQGHGPANRIRRSPIRISRTDPRIMRWTREKVLEALCKDPEGPPTVKILKDYEVYSYDSYTYKRQYYTDNTKTTKKGKPGTHTINGYHRRSAKEIALLSSRSDEQAASTLVHEVVHAKQHMEFEEKQKVDPTATAPTKAEKEYGAHIKQEEYNIRNNIPSKDPSFRKKVGDKWVVDEAAIKTWVDRVYGIGPAKHYTDYDKKIVGKTGPLAPWECKP